MAVLSTRILFRTPACLDPGVFFLITFFFALELLVIGLSEILGLLYIALIAANGACILNGRRDISDFKINGFTTWNGTFQSRPIDCILVRPPRICPLTDIIVIVFTKILGCWGIKTGILFFG